MRFAHSSRASGAVRQPSSPRAAHPAGGFCRIGDEVSYTTNSLPQSFLQQAVIKAPSIIFISACLFQRASCVHFANSSSVHLT